jgi:diadenosine tetraphosphatase ApaH/serine/threonine PP2A family protein phosphatase
VRFAAIADIHGNCLALEAVLADIDEQGIAEVVNLGDHFSGPLEAARTAELLLSRGFLSIRGNHDRWLIETPPEKMGISDLAAYRELTPAHLEWIANLPETATYGEDVLLCHGTPASDTTYWLEAVSAEGQVAGASRASIEAVAEGHDYPLILCGHTHIPRTVRLADGRQVVNPGSVGCPGYTDDVPVEHVVASGTPDACYAILDRGPNGWSVTHRHVPYDHMAMSRLAAERSRPDWAEALATGWIG